MTPITWYITFKLDDRNFFSFFSLLYHHCRLWRAHLTLFRHHFFTPSLLPNTTSPCSLTMSKRNFWTLILGLHIHKLSRLNPHQHNQTPQLKNRDHTITKNIDLNMSTQKKKKKEPEIHLEESRQIQHKRWKLYIVVNDRHGDTNMEMGRITLKNSEFRNEF